eukprot:scaffold87_cov303-Chaetoceros_neogracile.AAC.9
MECYQISTQKSTRTHPLTSTFIQLLLFWQIQWPYRLRRIIDDLNLPEVDTYNTQSAIAHLRQHMELQRWFATFAIGLSGSTSLLTIYQTFLDGHLANFNDEVKAVMNNLIKGALGLHASVSGTFKKTAANFHYEFNIRHISNVFQGLLVSEPKQFISADKFVLLWLHESERVYGDCLVSLADLTKYNNLTQIQCKKHFPSFPIAKFYAKENAVPLVFCHFVQTIENPIYDQVTCLHSTNEVLENALREYNETYATMDLVLFEDAMKLEHETCLWWCLARSEEFLERWRG